MSKQEQLLTCDGLIEHLRKKGIEELEPGVFVIWEESEAEVELLVITKGNSYRESVSHFRRLLKESMEKVEGRRIEYVILFTKNYLVFMRTVVEGLEPKIVVLKKSYNKITPVFKKKVEKLVEDIKNPKLWEHLFDRSDLIEEFNKLYLKARKNLLNNIKGINDDTLKEEFVDNLLMQMLIIWYLQEKGFLDNNTNYLIDMFNKYKALGFNNYYDFLKELFNTMQKKPNQGIYYNDSKLGKIVVTGVAPFIADFNDEDVMNVKIPEKVFYKKGATKKLVETEPRKLKPEDVPILNLLESRDWAEGNIDKFVLGAIFEKLLTPEERKSKGAYYTPEIITKYISENTIHPYLLDKINEEFHTNYKTLKEFFESEKDVKKYKRMFEVLQELKIVDPACGSGHFLESVIDTLVEIYGMIRKKIDELGFDENEFTIKVTDEEGNIQEKRLTDFKNEDEFKMHVKFHIIISRNIYGVDINKSAVYIARARLFLSIAEHFNANNKTYIMFPNVHFNLRRGNSLIGFTDFSGIDLLVNNELTKELDKQHANKQTTILDYIKRNDVPLRVQNKKSSNKNKISIFEHLKRIDSFLKNVETAIRIVDNKQKIPSIKYKLGDREYIYDSKLVNELLSLLYYNNQFNTENVIHLLEILSKFKKVMLVSLNSTHAETIKKIINRISMSFDKGLDTELLKHLKDKRVHLSEEVFEKLGHFHWVLEFPEVFLNGGFDIVLGNPPYVRQEKINHIVKGADYKKVLSALYKPYDRSFDFSMYFILRSIQLLKERGYHSFIITNKWMRAKYGKKMRKYLKENVTMKKVIDFNGVRVFVGVTVDTMIYVLKKQKPTKDNKTFYSAPGSFLSIKSIQEIPENEIHKIEEGRYYVTQSNLEDNVWNFLDEELLEIKKWIEKVGTSLKELKINAYIGVMTGYNEAFIIDDETRKKLIKEDPKSEKIIKPILKGRNISRYCLNWNKEWLIVIPSGFTKNLVGEELTEKEAEELFKKEFPLLYNHLSKFINKLKKRWNRGEFWWELRPCDYYQEFEKPKIVWQRVSKEPVFILDIAGMIVLDSTFFVTGDYELLKFLIVVLSSRFIEDYYLKNFAYVLSDGYLMSKQYIEKIPIRLPENSRPFSIIADYLLFLNAIKDRREEYKEVIEFFDKQIADSLVYELYFKEKFYEDGLYQEDKALFLEAVEKYLKKIDYDSWAKLYWKEQLERKLPETEKKRMRELEKKNLEIILQVYNVLKSSQKVSELVSKIKSHKWVRLIENAK